MNQAKPFAFATQSGNVVLSQVLEGYCIKSVEEQSNQLQEDTFSGINGIKEPLYPPKVLSHLSEMNTYHARSCRIKAADIGGYGYSVSPMGENPKPENKTKLETFFENSNPIFEETMTRAQQDYEEIGWGCLELIRTGHLDGGQPRRLEHIPAHTIRIHKDKNKFIQSWDGNKKVWFKKIGYEKDVHKATGKESSLGTLKPDERASELIYNYNYNSRTTYYGTPDYIPAIKTMLGDSAAVDYNIVFFKNYGVPAYAIFISGYYNDEPLKDKEGKPTGKSRIQKLMEDKYREVIENPHGSMIFSIPTRDPTSKVEIRFEKLAVETKDSSFRLYRMDNRDEIITSHGVDPYRLGITAIGSLGGNTAGEMKKTYKSTIQIPRQRTWSALINKYIIRAEKGFNITDHELKLLNWDIEDKTQKIKDDKELWSMGGLTPNEIRRRQGLEIVNHPFMDAYYVNGQPITLTNDDSGEDIPDRVAKILEDLADNMEAIIYDGFKSSGKAQKFFEAIKKIKP